MKRSLHSLSHTKLFSCDMGELIPCALTEVLPGDTVQMSTSALIRAAPLLAPVMHPVHVRFHHWYVPHRLVWEDFEEFITGGPDGLNASAPPAISIAGGTPGDIYDYYGIPPGFACSFSAIPFRGYKKIWNEYYRDADLHAEQPVLMTSGADGSSNALLNISWEKDYFTSSRPWEQKGPSITIPLGNTAPITGIGIDQASVASVDSSKAVFETAAATTFPFSVGTNAPGALRVRTSGGAMPTGPSVYADLSSASAVTVNILREALALQRFEEARARYGSRYVEYLRYLGVRSSDARLQRPEYLGGGRQTIQFSEVLQTAEGDEPVASLKGHGIGAMRSNRFRRFIEEHGYIHTLMSCRPRTIYMQGIPRTFWRRTKEDYWQRELEHIGQQEVLTRELYGSAPAAEVFGYQDRYDEYRRTESSVAGEFRTAALNHWHFAREFGAKPALNASFVTCIPTDRTFASGATDVLYVMARHSIQARRLVTKVGSSHIF